MGPYLHYFLAARLQPILQPEEPGEYFWGSVIPDIRYLAQLRREHTHVNPQRLVEWLQCYPHLKSFLLGYQVHCWIDRVDVAGLVQSAFPLSLLTRLTRRELSAQQLTMLVEMDYLNRPVPAAFRLAGTHNEVLDGLGITPAQSEGFFQAMQGYIDSHSIDTAILAMVDLGMIENARLEKYRQAYQTLTNKKLIRALLMMSVRRAHLDEVALAVVKEILSER